MKMEKTQDAEDVDKGTKTTIEEAAAAGSAEPTTQEEANRLTKNSTEFSHQLGKKLQGPLTRFQSDQQDDTRRRTGEDEFEFSSTENATCSESPSESCWNYLCPLPPELLGASRQDGGTAEDDAAIRDMAASIISAFGLTPSFTHHAGSDINLLHMPKTDDVPQGLTPSEDFSRNNPPSRPPSEYFVQNPLGIPRDEIQRAMNGFANMYLAHEICINDDFDLEKCMPEPEGLAYRVHKQAKQAYWARFEEIFHKGTTPNYVMAAKILGEVKEEMLGILLPQHRRIKQVIEETLDIEQIVTQIENRAFNPEDFRKYASFIIDTLGNLCSPARDGDVRAMRELKTIGQVLRAIFDLIEKMKLDMANFVLRQTRPLIIKYCVHYERTKFAEFLDLEYRLHDDGLKATRLWLKRHVAEDREPRIVVAKAFGELLNYNETHPWPETLVLDTARLHEMALQIKRLALIGTAILEASVVLQVHFGERFVHELREKAKKHLKLIVSTNDMMTDEERTEAILRIAEEMCVLINEAISVKQKRDISESEKQKIRSCILEIKEPEHKVHNLMLKRLHEYIDEVVCARWAYPIAMPAGIATIHHEVYGTLTQFYRLINHNRRVYNPLYHGIVDGSIKPPRYSEDNDGKRDEDLDKLLEELRRDFEEDEEDVKKRREDNKRVKEAQAQLPDGIN